jgi:hypothetical protein
LVSITGKACHLEREHIRPNRKQDTNAPTAVNAITGAVDERGRVPTHLPGVADLSTAAQRSEEIRIRAGSTRPEDTCIFIYLSFHEISFWLSGQSEVSKCMTQRAEHIIGARKLLCMRG